MKIKQLINKGTPQFETRLIVKKEDSRATLTFCRN